MTIKNSNIESFKDFGKTFQENVLFLIVKDRNFSDQIREVIEVSYFEHKYLQVLCQKVFQYKDKYGTHPNEETIKTVLKTEIISETQTIQEQVNEFFDRVILGQKNIENQEFIKDQSLQFCKKQVIKKAMLESIDLLQKASFDEISVTLNDALKKGIDNNVGHDFILDFEERYKINVRKPISTGFESLDRITKGGPGKGDLCVVLGSSGCHAKGTKIIMFDGSLKNVEDIKEGDLLLGPDSKYRKVLRLLGGYDDMYEITPIKGEKFAVNAEHVLSLEKNCSRKKNGKRVYEKKIVNISVKEYLNQKINFKATTKLYRSKCIEFDNKKELLLDPYILGLLIGDGCYTDSNFHQVSFINMDRELLDEISDYMLKENLCKKISKCHKKNTKAEVIKFTGNYCGKGKLHPLFLLMEKMGIRGKGVKEKFIPFEYLTTTKENRLKLLAGLLDTDGYLHEGGYEIITKFDRLKNDILFLARSLGLAAYSSIKIVKMNEKELKYHRISISGECSEIPCKLKRKQISEKRKQIKNWLLTGFNIEKIGKDNYYGFELDGDHLYMMSDFTVTHNSGKSFVLTWMGTQALKLGKNVVHYTLELSDKHVGNRYDSCLTGVPLNDLHDYKEQIYDKIKSVPGKLIIKEYPTKSISTRGIKSHLEKIKQRGVQIDMIIVDYLDLLKSTSSYKDKRHELESITEDLRSIGQYFECPLWTVSQCNRGSLSEEVVDLSSISEAYSKVFPADFIMTLSRTKQDKVANTARFFVAKNRNGPDGIVFPVFFDPSNVNIKMLDEKQEIKLVGNETSNEKEDDRETISKKYKNYRKTR